MLDAHSQVEPAEAAARRAGAEVVVDRVSKSYDSRIVAVREVSMRLERGEFVSLTGPSGCGKSTLLNLIGSLLRPDSGSISVDGIAVQDLKRPADYRRTTVGFVFQLHHLLPTVGAGTNVEVPLIGSGLSRRERRERARELLGEVGLAERVDHLPSQLSGGERQRVALARALANRPRLLLADEPTGALDTATGEQILSLLEAVRAEQGTT